ncbi:DUF2252 domain-containing protein [Variovorax ginsengisoli]|uniref:DUF2252 domain-containing protein n=1 Tax=Variovorax ginsengisoli TaxID=363844 RepID=A0ABT8RYL8_9BURK|nr:DUF2252 domain-containing protein [Variovorax ginsengisoli]MDN8612593.1 DUF2252 domain-containing protein [Variovorax ginsengisoli]MDO1531763.1 DUF2252 domain-containing protein [Variovorax ginsengisoli]
MARADRADPDEELDRRARALASAFTTPRPSVEERMAMGKALRERLPRASHGAFERSPQVDPVAILLAQASTRIPELIPVRHARMLQSPFAFLRGAAAVMAADLAPSPSTGLQVQACGDMHVANFGVFASAERQLVFAINDFDETQPGPWEWDVKRLAASAYVAADHLACDKAGREAAARAAVESYRSRMRRYAGMGQLEVWYDTIHSDRLLESLPPAMRGSADAVLDKARKRTHMQVLDKMTDLVDDQHRIIEQHPFIVRASVTSMGRPVDEAIGHCLAHYLDSLAPDRRLLLSRYRVLDAAQKVVGVGSVGTRCWVVLMQGRDWDDPLFLQLKEAQPSVLEAYVGCAASPDAPTNHGERVVRGQRLIQGSPDIFLGWGEIDGVHFYIRQLRDMKGGVELEPGQTTQAGFIEYCRLCGWALALAHAKSGDAAMIGGYLGKSDVFDDALVAFATAYGAQTEADHARFAAAAREGLVEVAE